MAVDTLSPSAVSTDDAVQESPESSQDAPLADDLLVEEVSIDGMCGVY